MTKPFATLREPIDKDSARRARADAAYQEAVRAHHREQKTRNAIARSRALTALRRKYPDAYRTFYLAAKAEVDAERGDR